MKAETLIEWTMMTGGPWMVCSEVSPGCMNCYARELLMSRLEPLIRKAYKAAGLEDWATRKVWGEKAPRVMTKGFWKDARSTNAHAERKQKRVFWFPSLIDWLDEMPAGIIDQDGNWLTREEVFIQFLNTIYTTPFITWQLLTKRPELFRKRLAAAYDYFQSGDGPLKRSIAAWLEGRPPSNVWIGATTEDQPRADERIPQVLAIPAEVTFLSVEPMLERINLRLEEHAAKAKRKIALAIFGGESGAGARACNMDGIRDGVRQCRRAGVMAFVKQMGCNAFDETTPEIPPTEAEAEQWQREGWTRMTGFRAQEFWKKNYRFMHPKGGDPKEWPADLRVREFPGIVVKTTKQ